MHRKSYEVISSVNVQYWSEIPVPPAEFLEKINEAMAAGAQLVGGICVADARGELCYARFFQAVVYPERPETFLG